MGEATARLFVREGARVVIGDLRREEDEAVDASIGPERCVVATDVDSSENALEQVKSNAAKLSDRRRRLLLGENASALYNLGV